MAEAADYVEKNLDTLLEELIELCRIPGVSAWGTGLEEVAEVLSTRLAGLGAEVGVFRAQEDAPPILFGELPGKSDKSLLFYNHYDVQPPDPLDEWDSDPFSPEIREGKVYGRGIEDNKGNLMARLHAVEAILKTEGELPITVKFVFEGNEEVGSPQFGEFSRTHGEFLKADACIWEAGGKDHKGRPNIYLGVKGICYVELRAYGARSDMHSSNATICPNPAWRLNWALSTLKDRDERILIDGFYDDVREPTDAELEALNAISFPEKEAKEQWGISEMVLGLEGTALMKKHLLEPTCTICGLYSGYTDEGLKTVLPRQAMAKVDFRLVPDQRPEVMVDKLRAYLTKKGFGDIEVISIGGMLPARTPLDSDFAMLLAETAREAYGREPVVYHNLVGSSPMYHVSETHRVPTAMVGIGYPGDNVHAPNENIRVQDYLEGMKYLILIIERLGR